MSIVYNSVAPGPRSQLRPIPASRKAVCHSCRTALRIGEMHRRAWSMFEFFQGQGLVIRASLTVGLLRVWLSITSVWANPTQ